MEEIDLKELIGMFLEKKFLIILVVVLFAILGAVYTTKFITPLYESSTSLVLVQTGSEQTIDSSLAMSGSITTSDITLNSKLVDAYAVIAKSKRVASKVVENLDLNMTADSLRETISISSASDTQNIKVSVKHVNPEEACKIANEVAEVFIEEVVSIYKVENLYILDPAEVNNSPCNVNLTKNIIIFAFVGAILVCGYILLINMLDTTIKTDTDIEKTISVPVLASIVLTDESNKKKNKVIRQGIKKDTKVKTVEPYESTVQFFYENTINSIKTDEENDSLFSYVNKKDLEENTTQKSTTKTTTSSGGRRKKTKKGGN